MAIKYLSINNDSIDFSNILQNNSNLDSIFFKSPSTQNECYINIRDSSFNMSNSTLRKGEFTNPYNVYTGMSFCQKDTQNYYSNEDSIGKMEMAYEYDNKCYLTQIMTYIPVVGRNDFASVSIRAYQDGTYKCMSATPNINSNESEIATTYWVRALLRQLGLPA